MTAALLLYVGVAFVVEPSGGRAGELAIGAVTWLILIALVRRAPRAERIQVAALVLVATAGEALGSPASACTRTAVAPSPRSSRRATGSCTSRARG